jgi:hypothetical protein
VPRPQSSEDPGTSASSLQALESHSQLQLGAGKEDQCPLAMIR